MLCNFTYPTIGEWWFMIVILRYPIHYEEGWDYYDYTYFEED